MMFKGLAYVLIIIVYKFFSFAMLVLKLVQRKIFFIKISQKYMFENMFKSICNVEKMCYTLKVEFYKERILIEKKGMVAQWQKQIIMYMMPPA